MSSLLQVGKRATLERVAGSVLPPASLASLADLDVVDAAVRIQESEWRTVSRRDFARRLLGMTHGCMVLPAPVWDTVGQAILFARPQCSQWTTFDQFYWWTANLEAYNVPLFLDAVADDLALEAMLGACSFAWAKGRPELFVPHPRWRELFARVGYTVDGRPAARPSAPQVFYRGGRADSRFNWSWSRHYWTASFFAEAVGGTVYAALVEPEQLLGYAYCIDPHPIVDTMDRETPGRSIQIRPLDLDNYVRSEHWPHCSVPYRAAGSHPLGWLLVAPIWRGDVPGRCPECGAIVVDDGGLPPPESAREAFFGRTRISRDN